MLTDLRNLPDGVRERLRRNFGEDVLTQRHRGFDLERRTGELVEQRFTPAANIVELRSAGDNSAPTIAGYATIYEKGYDIFGGPEAGGWTEIMSRGSTRKSAEASRVDGSNEVKMFFDHDGLPLASTRAGTLILRSDQDGLWSEATPDLTSSWSQEIVSRLQRRELDAMSFAFTVLRQRWEDLDGNEDDPMTAPVRRIQEVRLFDVSVVSFPANPATSVDFLANRAAERAQQAAGCARGSGHDDEQVGMPLEQALALRGQPFAGGMSLADAKAARPA